MEKFSVGDVVRILDDIAKVHSLQEDHGGWVDDMALVSFYAVYRCSLFFTYPFNQSWQSLGQVGRVCKVFPTGDVRAVVNGRTWTFNSACLTPAPGENPPEVPSEY